MLGKIRRYVQGRLKRRRGRQELAALLRDASSAPLKILRPDWPRSLSNPTGFYLDCVRCFYTELPGPLREHRAYFQANRRGFGEDAFHVMWWMLFREFRPAQFLEIGIYRGQTLSLAALLQKQLSIPGHVTGISPFTSAGDTVSKYGRRIDYLEDTKQNFVHFQLPPPELIEAFSTDEVAVRRIAATAWDCIYIDGNHDYEVALQDWTNCRAAVKPGGLIVLDDAAAGTAYQPPVFATAGHPGPSKLASEIDPREFIELLRVGHNRVYQRNI